MISATAKHTPEMPYSKATSANDQPASAGTRRNSTTTAPNSVTQARNEPTSARAPSPRASVVQNADTFRRKRQPKLTSTANTTLRRKADQAPSDEGQCSPNSTWPTSRIGTARNAVKYAARPKSRASQKPRKT